MIAFPILGARRTSSSITIEAPMALISGASRPAFAQGTVGQPFKRDAGQRGTQSAAQEGQDDADQQVQPGASRACRGVTG